jgi:hypothetical protein
VHLENGRELVVKAPKNSAKNIYVQGLKVNGKKWNSTALPHEAIAEGGEIEFAMGPKPSAWGTGKDAAPVSITQDDETPTPRHDVIPAGGPLFDNTSATTSAFTSVDLPVTAGTRAVQYTLTSAAKDKAPTGWVLQGSADGQSWTDLDKRSGQSFDWDRQTRVFGVAEPGSYRHYRLVATGEVTLAEVELLS